METEVKKRGPKGPRIKEQDKRVVMSLTCKARHKKELTRLCKALIKRHESK
jgi:hypothetical protein